MTPLEETPRILRRGEQSIPIVLTDALRIPKVSNAQPPTAAGPVAPTPELPIFPTPADYATLSNIEKLQRHDKKITTTRELDFYDLIKNHDSVLLCIMSDEVDTHNNVLGALRNETYDVLNSDKIAREQYWLNFISMFRFDLYPVWPKGLTKKWCHFIWFPEVHVDSGRDVFHPKALTRILVRKGNSPSFSVALEEQIAAHTLDCSSSIKSLYA